MADRCESLKYSPGNPRYSLDAIQCIKLPGHEEDHSGYAGPFGRISWTDSNPFLPSRDLLLEEDYEYVEKQDPYLTLIYWLVGICAILVVYLVI